MNKTHVLKNQKEQKLKKIHMKSILSQVKNKTIIEDLETIKKYNESGFSFNIQNYKPNWKQWQTPKLGKKLTSTTNLSLNDAKKWEKQQISKAIINQNIKQEKNDGNEAKDGQVNSDDDQNWKENSGHTSVRKDLIFKRKSSKIQLQLKEIVKYSLLYPSRNNSQKIIQQNIEKLINKSYETRKQNKNKSGFSAQTLRSRTIRPSRFQQEPKKFDQSMFLKIVQGSHGQEAQQDILKKNRTKHLLKKSKALFIKNRTAHDYSLVNFIQKQILKLKAQSGRNTVSGNTSIQQHQQNYHPGFDIREENIIDVHRFIRGEAKNDEELSNYVTTKEMRKFQNKYDIYENIYKKTKDGFNCQKLDCNQMKELTLKNAIFLNEAYMQCNNRTRRKEIEKVMSNLRLYN